MPDLDLIPIPMGDEDAFTEAYFNPAAMAYGGILRTPPEHPATAIIFLLSGTKLVLPIETFRQIIEHADIPRNEVPESYYRAWGYDEKQDDSPPALDKP